MKFKDTVNKYLNPAAIYNANKTETTNKVAENLLEYGINPDEAEIVTDELMKIQNRRTPIINDLTDIILEQYGNISNSKKAEIDNLTDTYVDQMTNSTNRKSKKMLKKANSQLTSNSTDDERTQTLKETAQFYAIKDHITEAVKPANKYKARIRPVGTAIADSAAIIGIPYLIIDSLKRGDTTAADAVYQAIANTSSMNVETIVTETNNSWGMEQVSEHGITKVAASNVDGIGEISSHIDKTSADLTAKNISFRPLKPGEVGTYTAGIDK